MQVHTTNSNQTYFISTHAFISHNQYLLGRQRLDKCLQPLAGTSLNLAEAQSLLQALRVHLQQRRNDAQHYECARRADKSVIAYQPSHAQLGITLMVFHTTVLLVVLCKGQVTQPEHT